MPSAWFWLLVHNAAPPSLHGVREGPFPHFHTTMGRSDSLPLVAPGFVAFAKAIPPLRLICSQRPRREAVGSGKLIFRFPSRKMAVETAGSPRFPGHPECPLAVFLDPGRTGRARPLQRADVAPACVNDEGSREGRFRGSIAKPWDWLSTLRSEDHSSPRKTRFRLLGQA